MIILEDLPYKERLKYIERERAMNSRKLDGANSRKYKSILRNIFSIKNTLVNESIAENVFDVSLIDEKSGHYDFDIKVTQNDLKSGLEFIPIYFKELLDQMSTLKNHLVLRVDKKGSVLDVLNRNDLKNKWDDLKMNIISDNEKHPKLKQEDLVKIIESGDLEYSASAVEMAKAINMMLIYKSLFYGFINTGHLDKTSRFKQSFNSNIFPELVVDMTTLVKNEDIGDNQDKVTTLIFENTETSINENKFKKMFLNNYAFIKESFRDYSFSLFSLNEIDKQTYWPMSVKFAIKEQINASVSIEIEVDIEQVD